MLVAAALLWATGMNAQPGGQGGERPSDEEMVERMTSMLVERYGLSDDQSAKLKELNAEYAGKMPMMGGGGPQGGQGGQGGPGAGERPDSLQAPPAGERPEGGERPEMSDEDREARRAEMQATMEAYEAALKEIFTDEQFAAYEQDKQERRERGPQGGPQGGPQSE